MALPKTFTGGERLFAEDLNDNFNDLDGRVASLDDSAVQSTNVDNVVVLTQAAYDLLSPDPRTLYLITD
jgi:hypothetical protein